jgi:hypothetical protein
MSFAPYETSDIIGSFTEKDFDNYFEFSKNTVQPFGVEFPHKIWVSCNAFRYGRVLKTVVYIVVDENDDGSPLVEKWNIKNQRVFLLV